MARLESFGFSWEREIAEVKQHRNRKLDYLNKLKPPVLKEF